MPYTRGQSGYQACGQDPDTDRYEQLPLDAVHHHSAGIVMNAHDMASRERVGDHSGEPHRVSSAPEYESSKFYEWTTSGAETAALSQNASGYHPATVADNEKGPETSLQSGYGDDQAANWQQSQGHDAAVSSSSVSRLLHSSLDNLHDLGRTAKARCQDLIDFLQDSWLLEIGACMVALGLFIAEIVLLRSFEKHQVGKWPWGWSLNSAVALLTTFIEANLVFALTSCLGQMKWLWFSLDQGRMKRLIWVDLIARSNTPLDALSLLLRPTTWRNFFHKPVWSGAFCMIALLGMGLFSQNVITQRFTEIYTPGGGQISVSRGYDDWSLGRTGEALGDQGPTAAMASYGNLGFAYASNIIAGYSTYPYDDISLQGLAYCDHLNCTYGLFDTLSICPRCADVSQEISLQSGRYLLRDGVLSLDANRGAINITSGTEFSDWDRLGIRFPGPLLVHYLAMVRDNESQDTPPAAVECVAYWCAVLNYSEMLDGVLKEIRGTTYTFWSAPDAPNMDKNVVTNSSASARTSYGQEQDICIRPESCRLDQTTTSSAENCTFRVSAQAQLGLQNFLAKGWFGMPPLLSGSEERIGEDDESQEWRTTSLAAHAASFSCCAAAAADDCQSSLVESMSSSFSNLTAFMSNVIRKTPGDGPQYSVGTSSSTVLIYDLRWGWIAYPAAVIALVFSFVGYTVLQSRRTHLWKASILPAVFHSLPDIDATEMPALAFPDGMRRRAEALRAELETVNDPGAEKARWAWRSG